MSAFKFQQNVFTEDYNSKNFFIKISSKDSNINSPFDFNVKFDMNIGNSTNQFKKEAVVYSKYINIKSIEVSDVIIPRYIPTFLMGNNFDGVNLVQSDTNDFILSCFPGTYLKMGSVTLNSTTVNYIKINNHKESIFLLPIGYIIDNTAIENNCILKNHKVYDHVNINNNVHPITNILNNKITINNLNLVMPSSSKLIISNYNLLTYSDNTNCIVENKKLILNNFPVEMIENIYEGNILNINDGIGNYYFKVQKYIDISNNISFFGTWFNKPDILNTNLYINLFSYGSKDLLDERIFYLEMDPFRPVKSTATDNDLNNMFGVLFPSTQSKDWLYLSGEPKEFFLQRDYRKLDKINFKIYDSNKNNLNDIFTKKLGLFNSNYYSNIYTTIVLKIDELDKTLVNK